MVHAMHLAQLEASMLALLRFAGEGCGVNDIPDAVIAHLEPDGLYIEYRRGHVAIGGEGL